MTRDARRISMFCLVLASCVPRDPPAGSRSEPNAISIGSVTLQRWRPHPVAPIHVDIGDGTGGSGRESETPSTADPMLLGPFADSFARDSIGSDWVTTSDNWRIESGQLCGQSNRNHPLWLRRRIGPNARIAFLARARSEVGDIKVEVWGNGRSYAKANSYNDATSYLFIYGGWKNQFHVLARLNEHAPDRLELRVDRSAEDRRLLPVSPGVDYRFVIERSNGRTITWRVNDVELFRFEDREPLRGLEHDHFGFNNWESPVCFDDLLITPLPE